MDNERDILKFFKDTWSDLKEGVQDIFNGQNALHKSASASVRVLESVKEVLTYAGTVTKFTPPWWDDAIVLTFKEASKELIDRLEISEEFNECRDEERIVECVIRTLSELQEKSERDRMILKMAQQFHRQMVYDTTGEWIDKDRSERIVQAEYDMLKESEKFVNLR